MFTVDDMSSFAARFVDSRWYWTNVSWNTFCQSLNKEWNPVRGGTFGALYARERGFVVLANI